MIQGEEMRTYAMATGRLVRRPKVRVAMPETAAVAVTRSRRTSESKVSVERGARYGKILAFFASDVLRNVVARLPIAAIAFAGPARLRKQRGVDGDDVGHGSEGGQAGSDLSEKGGALDRLGLYERKSVSRQTRRDEGGKLTWPVPDSRNTLPSFEVVIHSSSASRKSRMPQKRERPGWSAALGSGEQTWLFMLTRMESTSDGRGSERVKREMGRDMRGGCRRVQMGGDLRGDVRSEVGLKGCSCLEIYCLLSMLTTTILFLLP